MIRVAVIDDQAIILNGIQKILADEAKIEIVGLYQSAISFLESLKISKPDVALIDIQMPGMNGHDLADQVSRQYPGVRMIALTNVDMLLPMKQMLQRGCLGYLLKDVSPELLIKAIETVYNGEQFLHESLKNQLLKSVTGHHSKQIITRREKEILKLIIEENTNQEIANSLFISLRTVENHRNNLLQKLNVKNTAGLVKVALQEGLV
jgi:DNA-binding NarL/FixJ family response regulator